MGTHLPAARRLEPLENLHLTLAFLGDQSRVLLDALAARLSVAPLPPTLWVRGDRVRPFPDPNSALLALELNPTPELMALQQTIAEIALSIGLPQEPRPFRPHLTLARGRGAAVEVRCDIELKFSAVGIYHSIHAPDGTRRYQSLSCIDLVRERS